MRAIALLGRDWTELGPLALAELPDGGALALSRGALPKAYAHTDPNEDAALVVRTPSGILLAVADGFNGTEASELAIALARARAADLVLASSDAFRAEVARLADDVVRGLPRGSRSRSCLVLAALRGDRIELAHLGDSNAFVAGTPRSLATDNPVLLGNPESLNRIRPEVFHLRHTRANGERIALVSDGVTNFMREPAAIPNLLASAPNDLEAARAIAEAALTGGAGDNVAVAVFAGHAGV